MKSIDQIETCRWLDNHRISYIPGPPGINHYVEAPETGYNIKFRIPEEGNTRLLLAWKLGRIPQGTDVLLWLSRVGDADEEIEFFQAWRNSHGEQRLVPEAAGYLFNLTEHQDRWKLTEVMSFLFNLNWEGFIVQPDGPDVIWLADEVVDLVVQNRETRDQIVKHLDTLYIEPYD